MPTKQERREQIAARHRPAMSTEARILLDEYDRAWSVLGSSMKVQATLELTDEEHWDISAWRECGAERVVARREGSS